MLRYRFEWFTAGVLILAASCGGNSDPSENTLLAPREVEVTLPAAHDFFRSIEASGSLVAAEKAVIRALQDGPIVSLGVDIGSEVRKGEVLFRTRDVEARLAVETLEARLATARATLADLQAWQRAEEVDIIRARVDQARAEYDRLKNEFERADALKEKGAVSTSQWEAARTAAENARAGLRIQEEQLSIAESGPTAESLEIVRRRVDEAQVALQQARQNLADTIVHSPFDGAITAKFRQPGDFVRRGEEVLEVKQLAMLHAEVEIPERYASDLRTAIRVTLTVESASLEREGKVVAVNDSIETSTRTFQVKVALDNSDRLVKAGAFCVALFELPSVTGATSVPLSALHSEEGRSFLWVVDDGVAVKRTVEPGEKDSAWVQVEGIDPDTQVVISGAGALSNGDPVRIIEQS